MLIDSGTIAASCTACGLLYFQLVYHRDAVTYAHIGTCWRRVNQMPVD